jgi:hypothetical protein
MSATYPVIDVTTAADKWIETTLSADVPELGDPPSQIRLATEAPGGVWNEAAEQGTTGRIIRYAYLSGGTAGSSGAFGNLEIINNEIVYEILLYLITMVAENNRFEDLDRGATRIKQLLHRGSGTVTGARILWCRYLVPHKERVPHEGLFYPEKGGVYQIAVQPTA